MTPENPVAATPETPRQAPVPDGRTPTDQVAHPAVALALIMCCQLMVVLDATIVNIALPQIRTDLGFTASGLSWVVNAYTLTFGGLMLLGGRAGDLLGYRRMFVAGTLLFAAASLFGGLTGTPELLLVARAAQGVGGALAAPAALALIAVTFPAGQPRDRAYATFSMVSGAAMAIGLVLGGVLTDALSWRWVFYVNVPLGIAIAALGAVFLARPRTRYGRFDLAGAFTSTAGTTLLVYGFVRAAERGWSDRLTIGSFVTAVILLGTFVLVEARAAQPIMPLWLFTHRARAGAYLARLLLTASMTGMLFFLTLYVQDVLEYSPLRTAFAFLPTIVPLITTPRLAARLLPRTGPKPIMVSGGIVTVIGMVWLTRITDDSGYVAAVLGPVILFGAGAGLLFVAIIHVALADVPATDTGIASGALQSMHQLGTSVGVAVLVTAFATVGRGVATDPRGLPDTLMAEGIARAFTAAAVLAVGVLVITLLGARTRLPDRK